MSSPIPILFLGVMVAVFAIVTGALTEGNIAIIAIFALGAAVYFAFVSGDGAGSRSDGR